MSFVHDASQVTQGHKEDHMKATYETPTVLQSGEAVRDTLGKGSGTEINGVGLRQSAGSVGFNL